MYIHFDDLDLHYDIIGEGTPILMIHGFGVDMNVMKGCMEPLFNKNRTYQRIYLDLPGMGRTKNRSLVYSADTILQVLMNFIEKVIGNQPFLLVGESYGGYLSRGILSKIPQSILGILFICPVIYPDSSQRILPTNSMKIENLELWRTLKKEEKMMFESEFFLFNKLTYERGVNEVLIGNQNADKDALKKISECYSFSKWFVEPHFDGATTFLLGKQDSVVGYKDAFNLMENYKTATYIALNGAGHNFQIEAPCIFESMVSQWLDSIS